MTRTDATVDQLNTKHHTTPTPHNTNNPTTQSRPRLPTNPSSHDTNPQRHTRSTTTTTTDLTTKHRRTTARHRNDTRDTDPTLLLYKTQQNKTPQIQRRTIRPQPTHHPATTPTQRVRHQPLFLSRPFTRMTTRTMTRADATADQLHTPRDTDPTQHTSTINTTDSTTHTIHAFGAGKRRC